MKEEGINAGPIYTLLRAVVPIMRKSGNMEKLTLNWLNQTSEKMTQSYKTLEFKTINTTTLLFYLLMLVDKFCLLQKQR